MGKRARSMATASTSAECGSLADYVDESYLHALTTTGEDLYPISDEYFASELEIQEALVSSFAAAAVAFAPSVSRKRKQRSASPDLGGRHSSSSANAARNLILCKICMEAEPPSKMFRGSCGHSFCRICLGRFIGGELQKGEVARVRCPEVGCEASMDPEFCRDLVPPEVFERWERVLCEALISGDGHRSLYCPFKDCSELMLDDEDDGEQVTKAECPSCRRLFCARCRVAWHSEFSCKE